MKKISQPIQTSFREKGSKFISYLFPAESPDEFNEKLEKLKSNYPDATHHCYAWRIFPNRIEEFAQDDGEPSGSAGLPILNQLKSYEVVNAAVVVVRYYGGTKLGKSGLINAYGAAAQQCLNQVNLLPIRLIQKVQITYPYSEQNSIEKLVHQFDLQELNATYREVVTLLAGCPLQNHISLKKHLVQLEHRNIKAQFLGKSHM